MFNSDAIIESQDPSIPLRSNRDDKLDHTSLII